MRENFRESDEGGEGLYPSIACVKLLPASNAYRAEQVSDMPKGTQQSCYFQKEAPQLSSQEHGLWSKTAKVQISCVTLNKLPNVSVPPFIILPI